MDGSQSLTRQSLRVEPPKAAENKAPCDRCQRKKQIDALFICLQCPPKEEEGRFKSFCEECFPRFHRDHKRQELDKFLSGKNQKIFKYLAGIGKNNEEIIMARTSLKRRFDEIVDYVDEEIVPYFERRAGEIQSQCKRVLHNGDGEPAKRLKLLMEIDERQTDLSQRQQKFLTAVEEFNKKTRALLVEDENSEEDGEEEEINCENPEENDDEMMQHFFVKGLSANVTEKEISSLFSGFAPVNQITLSTMVPGCGSRYAYVSFKTVVQLSQLVDFINQREHDYPGLDVRPRIPAPVSSAPKECKIRVTNVQMKTRVDDIKQFFEKYGKVTSVRMLELSAVDRDKKTCGFMITFENSGAARNVVGQPLLKFNNIALHVELAE